jgi:separase
VTPAIDTLFLLARAHLEPTRPNTIPRSFQLVSRACSFVGLQPSSKLNDMPMCDNPMKEAVVAFGQERTANYVRCISGAFHNLAGTLYQAGQYAQAIIFLVEGCRLGVMAIKAYHASSRMEDDSSVWKHEDAWKQLSDQLYRRWELLGACYARIGDHKVSNSISIMMMASRSFLK